MARLPLYHLNQKENRGVEEPMIKNNLKPLSLMWGLIILVFTASLFITASLLFAVRIPITPFHFWIASALTVVFAWFAAKNHFSDRQPLFFAVTLLVPLVLFLVFLWVSGRFYDITYDGQAYHQETVILLKNGWNPFYDQPLQLSTGHDIWINHYARAPEIVAAVLYAVTGHIELSKVFNFMLIAGSFFMGLSALLTYQPQKTARALFIAFVLACNPVSLCQAFGFYIDGQLGTLLLYLISLSYLLFVKTDRWIFSVFSLCLILTVNNKFTAIGYAAVIVLGLLIALYMSEKFEGLKTTLKISVISALLGLLVFGFNPYVTNTLRHGHPFYPLAGPGAKDVVEEFTPESFKTMNRFQRLLVSNFSVSEENSTTKLGTTLKIPFTFTSKELTPFREPDVSIAGFGPLFGGTLLLALVIGLLSLRLNVSRSLAALGIAAVLLISAAINPAAWWARYVPQLWVIPAVFALLGLSYDNKKAMHALSWVLMGVMTLNVALIAYTNFSFQWKANQKLKEQLQTVAKAPQPVPVDFTYSWSNRARFEELGIAYEEVKEMKGCPNPLTLYRTGTTVCLSGKQ
jgi:hypothetical protein